MFLVAFYLLASIEVGHLPVYGNPDPKDSIFAPFMTVIWVAMLMTMFTLPYGIVFTIFHFVEHQSASTVWTRLAIYIVPIIVFFILNYYSPIMVWFAD
jgi:hypothetical protein